MKKNPSVEEVMEVAQLGAWFTARADESKILRTPYQAQVLEKTTNSILLHLPAKQYINGSKGGITTTGWITFKAFHDEYDTGIN